MTVILLVIVVACLVGVARGGTMHNLSQLHLAAWPLVFVAVAAQALGAFAATIGLPFASVLYVLGMISGAVLVTVFVARNRGLPGMPLVALGFLLNALVVTANGAMPVAQEAADRVGISTVGLYRHADAKHELVDGDTLLPALADVIPVPLPGPLSRGSNVVSAGDVVLAAGIGVLVVNAMLRVRRPHAPAHARR
ncbi:MAG TPA: DUF5317 domain-containing protein [Mycobacteriales bacterium]|nr:DUF5317 domain-containing protein [Mycobacteriales bacterium]